VILAAVYDCSFSVTSGTSKTKACSQLLEEIEQLKQIVARSLGIDLTSIESGEVEVQEMLFAANSTNLPAAEEEESGGFNLSDVMQFSSEIVGSIVAMVLFIVFLIMYRKLKDQPSPFDQMDRFAASAQSGGRGGAEITPDLLNQLISQRPESTASSIQSWMQEKDES
jgi:flagellar biosynthesis/type III secretory pathway M-ring protein FliF/YscJ